MEKNTGQVNLSGFNTQSQESLQIEAHLSGLTFKRFEQIDQKLESISNIIIETSDRLTMLRRHEVKDTINYEQSIEELGKKFSDFKFITEERLKKLENLNKKNQIKSFKDLKAELNALVTKDSYSKLLRTKSFFKKILWLICVIPLFIYCMIVVRQHLVEFKENNVVTQTLVKNEKMMVFPAITFCIHGFTAFNEIQSVTLNLSNAFEDCVFDNETCTLDKFEKITIYDFVHHSDLDCYKFNGGQNPISTAKFGAHSGLTIGFNISRQAYISYYVSDNAVEPTYTEMMSINQPHEIILAGIKKTVDIKLPLPYNNCTQCKTVSYEIYENVYNPYESVGSLLKMNFFIAEGKYTEISQLIKITEADLISNTGGVLGLFLELNFFSFYRFLVFLFDVIF